MKKEALEQTTVSGQKPRMSPEAQRIAILEACGWKDIHPEWDWIGYLTNQENEQGQHVPDYLNDLNAMHEAEESLSRSNQRSFAHNLTKLILFKDDKLKRYALDDEANDLDEDYAVLHAKAAQRAEAFLRALSLWDDTK